jgi:TolB-like protein
MNKHGLKGVLLLLVLLIGSVTFAMAQNGKEKIAILPFFGGSSDERDGIAELLSYTSTISSEFTIIPRTSINDAVSQEQLFQYDSGMTNEDTMIELGQQLGAIYMISGSITKLGNANLLIVYMIQIDRIKQVAGAYITYNTLEELVQDPAILENLAEELVDMMDNENPDAERLAIVPVDFGQNSAANEAEGDALAQLLSIALIRNGQYAVYPRTTSLSQVQAEYENQYDGNTREDQAVEVGEGENPEYVLSIVSRRIGASNTFNASIMDLKEGTQVVGTSQAYSALSDGIQAMDILAARLGGGEESSSDVRNRERRERDLQRQMSDAEAVRKREEALNNFLTNSGINISAWFGIPSFETFNDPDPDLDDSALSFAILGEVRILNWFGVQTGFQLIQGSERGPASDPAIMETYFQVPLLAKVNFILEDFIGISIYGGLGLNLGHTGNNSAYELSPLLPSLIIGGEALMVVEGMGAFAGLQYNHEFQDSESANTVEIYMGLSYYFPFRR